MSWDSPKPIIFVSYAHDDEPEKPRGEEIQWLSFVMKFLRPAVKFGEIRIWVDRQMPGGTEWDEEIERHLRECNVFVLLVSANSMSSNYIIDKELKIARERRDKGELEVYPLLIEATPKAGLEGVRIFNLRPRNARPFQSYSLADRNQHMSDAADEIAEIAKQAADRKAAAGAAQNKLPELLTPKFEEFALTTKGRQGIVGPVTPDELKPRKPAILDIARLPRTGNQRLVGREAELKRLDEAWSDEETNVLSLIAKVGAGKSALVNEWLNRLQTDGYRRADCVLGWSFVSQRAKERTATADVFLNWALAKLGAKLEAASRPARGEAIADALMKRRALLILDGVEPLQRGPGPQTGELTDEGLRALLRRFAAASPRVNHSLIVVTSRVAVADLARFEHTAPVLHIGRLSDEEGAELLRDRDVWGIDEELRAASREVGGRPQKLASLAHYLNQSHNGDVRRRDD
jgi:hypothetical protein